MSSKPSLPLSCQSYAMLWVLSPKLHTLTFPLALANVKDVAHLDVATCGLWWSHNQKVFSDVKVFTF